MFAKIAAAGLVAAASFSFTAIPAAATEQASARSDCFFVSAWRGWSAPSDDVLLLKVRGNDIYRVELSAGSHRLKSAGNHLVSTPVNSMICSAIDLDLKVSDEHGHATPLIARSIARLTPEQIAAIPKKDRP